MPRRKIDPTALRRAEEMLAAGVPRARVAEETGIGTSTLGRRFPPVQREPLHADVPPVTSGAGGKPRPDPPPRRAGTRRRKVGPTDEQLEAMVRKVAKAPAIPAAVWLHCSYCSDHFLTSAGPLAAELIEVSHDDADLRGLLEGMYRGWKQYAWAGMLAAWLGVPLMHHAAPAGLYNLAGPVMGMPPRAGSSRGGHPHARPMPPAADYYGPVERFEQDVTDEVLGNVPASDAMPFARQLEQMDVNQILGMAASLGIELKPDGLAANLMGENGGPPTTPIPDVPELTFAEQERDLAAAAAEAAAAQAAALNADPDAQ